MRKDTVGNKKSGGARISTLISFEKNRKWKGGMGNLRKGVAK